MPAMLLLIPQILAYVEIAAKAAGVAAEVISAIQSDRAVIKKAIAEGRNPTAAEWAALLRNVDALENRILGRN